MDHNKLWKVLREMGIPDRLTCLLRNLYAGQEATVRTRYETTDSRSTGSRLRKEYVRLTERWQQAICCHFVCLIYTQSTSWESPGWMIYKAESRQAGETSIMILRYEDDATLRAESEEELKSLLMRVKEESERAGLRLNIRKLRSWHPAPLLHGK